MKGRGNYPEVTLQKSGVRQTLLAMSGTSLGYAERLSWRDDVGGTLGDPELSEPDVNDLEGKIDRLAELFRDAKDGGHSTHGSRNLNISGDTRLPRAQGGVDPAEEGRAHPTRQVQI